MILGSSLIHLKMYCLQKFWCRCVGIQEHFIVTKKKQKIMVTERKQWKKKNFIFFIFLYMRIKSIPLESPIFADFKYTICFLNAPMVTEKINCLYPYLRQIVYLDNFQLLSIYGCSVTIKIKICLDYYTM